MNIYLISNNLVVNDISYDTLATVDEKRMNRPLAIEGETLAYNLAQKLQVSDIYASTFASAICAAKYMSAKNNTIIHINSNLNDVKIGNMGRHNIKMLRFMQDKNFDYKYPGGESLNEAKLRMHKFLEEVKKYNSDVAVFTHKRAIMALLSNYTEKGYNLDDNLILTFHDEVILDDSEADIDIIKITIIDGKIKNIENIEMEELENGSTC